MRRTTFGQVKGEKLEVSVDGERVQLFDWDKEVADFAVTPSRAPRIPIKAGLHRVGVTFVATNYSPGNDLNNPFMRVTNAPGANPRLYVLSACRPGLD